MSSKGLGLTLIKKKQSIRDLYRWGLEKTFRKKINLNDLRIKEVMTVDFKFVSEEVLVSEAIKMKKI